MIRYILTTLTIIFVGTLATFADISYKGNTFYLYGEFGNKSALKFKEFIEQLPATEDEIHIRINSSGGAVFSLGMMINYLREFKGTVKTYNDGMVASCGFMFFMEGDYRYGNEYTVFLAHSVAGGANGKPQVLQHEAEFMDKLNKGFIKRLKELGMKNPEKYFGKDDTFLTYDEMVELNLITVTDKL